MPSLIYSSAYLSISLIVCCSRSLPGPFQAVVPRFSFGAYALSSHYILPTLLFRSSCIHQARLFATICQCSALQRPRGYVISSLFPRCWCDVVAMCRLAIPKHRTGQPASQYLSMACTSRHCHYNLPVTAKVLVYLHAISSHCCLSSQNTMCPPRRPHLSCIYRVNPSSFIETTQFRSLSPVVRRSLTIFCGSMQGVSLFWHLCRAVGLSIGMIPQCVCNKR